jgi:hypothetical protein
MGEVVDFPGAGEHPALGVPFDPGAFDRTDGLYQAIVAGEKDHELDGIEKAATARKRARSHPRMEPWTGPAPTGWTDGIAAGYYDCQGREGMQMILGAVTNRRSKLAVDDMKARTVALEVGDRVQVRTDAPLRPKYILGATGTVRKVNQTTATVVFDPGQYLGRFERGNHLGTRCPVGALDKIDAPARSIDNDARSLTEQAAPGTLVRADLFALSPAQAAVLAELVLLEVESLEDEGGRQAEANDLSDLYQRLDDHAKAAR